MCTNMFPILALDLDDTLYPERTYVDGGLRAVAGFLATECGGEAEDIARSLFSILDARGRGRVFDDYLHGVGRYSRRRVDACVRVYREHEPDISLYPAARRLLELMEGGPLYLVTDGNKLVQRRKTLALKLDRHFRKMFITHRHGVEHAKPSTYCFDRLRELDLVHARQRDVKANPVDGRHEQGEQHLVPQFGDAENVQKRVEHGERVGCAVEGVRAQTDEG